MTSIRRVLAGLPALVAGASLILVPLASTRPAVATRPPALALLGAPTCCEIQPPSLLLHPWPSWRPPAIRPPFRPVPPAPPVFDSTRV
jgi:hypothetical protein